MASRSFFVRVNLDDMADSLDAMDSTEERGLWVEGFRVGSRGKPARDTWDDAKRLGHEFGIACWEGAEAFREKQSAKGRASIESRRNATVVQPRFNHGSTPVEPENEPENEKSNQTSTKLQPRFNHGSTTVQTEGQPNQKPEARSQEEQQQPARAARGVARAPAERQEQAETIYQAYPRHQGKGAALPAILRALDRVPFDQLLEAVQAFAVAVQGWPEQDRQFVPHPATWIRGERWNDDRATWRRGEQNGRQRTAWNRLGSVDHLADVPGAERISPNVSIL